MPSVENARMIRVGSVICIALAALASLPVPRAVQAQGSRLPGAVETGLILRQIDGVKRVLMVAAHPDDEDTALLATLARGWGAEVAYFSFTRGEGGQNLIGTELGEGLGVIRSGELLAARSIDGAQQFFGRAFDFGYSKSAEETFAKWPREVVLADLVWTIRRFRPHVLLTMWSGNERDGHGHHQAAGLLAREAFEAAGDPARFPEQLEHGAEPWAASKLYRRPLFEPGAVSIEVETGTLDPLLGVTHHQLAMASRSQHRSQDFGSVQQPGPRTARLALVDSRVGGAATDPLMAGIDTTLAGLAMDFGASAQEEIRLYRDAVRRAAGALVVTSPESVLPYLAEARQRLGRLRAMVAQEPPGELAREVGRRAQLLDRAILAAAGVRVELRVRDDIVVPGQTVEVEARVWSGRDAFVQLDPPAIEAPAGWIVKGLGPGDERQPDDLGAAARFIRRDEAASDPSATARIESGQLALWRYAVTVPEDARPTSPYYTERPRRGDVYEWPDDAAAWTLPFRASPLRGRVAVHLSASGEQISAEVEEPVRYRGVDGVTGEYWRPLIVAPRISVEPSAELALWPSDDFDPREIAFRLVNFGPDSISGTVELELPAGWRSTPELVPFHLSAGEAAGTATFRVEPASNDGEFVLRPYVRTGRDDAPREAAVRADIIEYPHIEPRLAISDPATRIARFPLQAAQRRIGYVMGSGDGGPEAIRQLGMEVEPIEPGGWDRGQLDRFDTIVLGVRAYEVRGDLVAANPELLEWVKRGGTVIVQYNRYEFNQGSYAPYPMRIARPAPRVTREDAEVEMLDETAPLFAWPNRIGSADFEGWVQERGLYFPAEWDQRYHALLEMSDPGEDPQRGSLLAAPYGQGLYIHTSLSFFRQLPAGVPGAFRLWANLLSAGGGSWRRATSG